MLWLSSVFLLALFLYFLWSRVLNPFMKSLHRDKLLHEFCSGSPSSFLCNKRVLVLANPAGGARNAMDVVESLIVPVLRHHKADVTVVGTRKNCEGLESSFQQKDFDLMVLASGDGTLHQLLNTIGLPKIPLVLFPCGSSNGLATSLGSSTIRGALQSLTRGSPKWCDALEVSFVDQSSNIVVKKNELQVMALGIIAEHDVLQEETLRPYMGPLLRGLVAPLIVMLRANWWKFRMSFVSSETVQAKMEKLKVANTLPSMRKNRHAFDFEASAVLIGGSAYGDTTGRVFPNEELNDGACSVLTFLRDRPLGLIMTFLAIHSNGSHLSREKIRRWPFVELEIEYEDPKHSQHYVVTLSGERYRASGPIKCVVKPNALQLVYCEMKV